MSSLLSQARRVQIDRHVLALGEAVEHVFQREFADTALLVAAVGVAGSLAQPWLTWTQPDSIACAAQTAADVVGAPTAAP
jgi:hypothetical protein